MLFYSGKASESVIFYAGRTVHFYLYDDADAYSRFRHDLERIPGAVVVTDAPGLNELGATAEMHILRAVGPCIVMRPSIAIAADPPRLKISE